MVGAVTFNKSSSARKGGMGAAAWTPMTRGGLAQAEDTQDSEVVERRAKVSEGNSTGADDRSTGQASRDQFVGQPKISSLITVGKKSESLTDEAPPAGIKPGPHSLSPVSP